MGFRYPYRNPIVILVQVKDDESVSQRRFIFSDAKVQQKPYAMG